MNNSIPTCRALLSGDNTSTIGDKCIPTHNDSNEPNGCPKFWHLGNDSTPGNGDSVPMCHQPVVCASAKPGSRGDYVCIQQNNQAKCPDGFGPFNGDNNSPYCLNKSN